MQPLEFVRKWRGIQVNERRAYYEHFTDLCSLVGAKTPLEEDPTGTFYTFEAGVTKLNGGKGWADVWKKGYFAIEYKGKHGNLNRAYDQLLQYREALLNPPLLIVSDLDSLVIHTNFTNTVKKVTTLPLDETLTRNGLDTIRSIFYAPDLFRSPITPERVTEEVAAKFARLAQLITRYEKHAAPQEIAHFLTRLLFCLFAEDVNLLPKDIFSRLVTQTRGKSSAFTAQLSQLFNVMTTGGWFGIEEIRHFNGSLFDNATVLPMDSEALDILVDICSYDWSSIEPAIFGTLFERSLDPAKRKQLGAHYTSKDDILLLVEPVVIQPLREEWIKQEQVIEGLVVQRNEAVGNDVTKINRQIEFQINTFLHKVRSIKVLDPACGSGNFLYIALKLLLDLEKDVIRFGADVGLPLQIPQVNPEQFLGMEVNAYAHELAQITIWIGYIQWMKENGFGNLSEPILKSLKTIRHMDAILRVDAQGNFSEPIWPEADFIIGNPPFLGGNKIRQELSDGYVDGLFNCYEERLPAFSDLVCYWFEKARAMVTQGKTQRAGLIATNSIRGGANRKVLERIKASSEIFMAWSDRPWILNGATVRISMVGFSKTTADKWLNGSLVTQIHSDLTTDINISNAYILEENNNICFMGPSPKASFDIPDCVAKEMLDQPININGRPNSDVIRPVMSATDVVQRNRKKYTIDFGLQSLEEACQYEAPFAYIREHVYPIRSANKRASYASKWWQYAEARPGMRKAVAKLQRYIVTPAVAKYRIFIWIESRILSNQGTLVFARDDDYFFGVLHSRIHELWSLRQGTSLEDRPRYTPTTTFETFPFPWMPGNEPKDNYLFHAISEAAKELVEKRDRWLNPLGVSSEELAKRTLTNLYNERPTWLDIVHKKLDKAVFAAYGWPDTLTDDEILGRLLVLNHGRSI
ncbi:class I SAM-dependent DNA methyltransferase [Herpetosiphon llansteffanensis]|uniref:class I SAM-dependent DNA methyltransferase n=1 Tax=Herpetosiphon llansteffanensis TaxID=2094568 RepID=UPI000D7CB890|nr:DNA methyltransferase [Herpetosiphon llansteffanensis]